MASESMTITSLAKPSNSPRDNREGKPRFVLVHQDAALRILRSSFRASRCLVVFLSEATLSHRTMLVHETLSIEAGSGPFPNKIFDRDPLSAIAPEYRLCFL